MLLLILLTVPMQETLSQERPHHTPDGFRNQYPHPERGFGDFFKWRWDWAMGRTPERPPSDPPTPATKADVDFLRKNRELPTITWIGHATFLLQVGGRNILTDPQFSERASPFSWIGPRRMY
ncbi:MAG: MBL fold metallo-hydrolase, partial [bacterium]